MTELEYALKYAKERCKASSDFTEEMAHQVDEYRKRSIQDTKALKSLKDEVYGLSEALQDALQRLTEHIWSPKMTCGAGKEVLP